MSVRGQNAKYSPRADVFRFATNIRHRTGSACSCQQITNRATVPVSASGSANTSIIQRLRYGAMGGRFSRPTRKAAVCCRNPAVSGEIERVIAPNLREFANDLELSLPGSSRTSRACLVPGANIRLLVTQCSAEIDFHHSRR
jgi:hypothetical protein